jgi:MAP/microtubule affinity-regulating kinase
MMMPGMPTTGTIGGTPLNNNYSSGFSGTGGMQQQMQSMHNTPTYPSVGVGATTESAEDVKPRSLRFTWSMKTTSSLAPEEMMR